MNISIKQTEREYLLRIPPAQRYRAKEIEGRRWDNDRKVWVYSKTKRMYRTLLAEFGDDLQELEITPPDFDTDTKNSTDMFALVRSAEAENAELKKRIKELSAAETDTKITTLQSTNAELESKIAGLETDLDVKQNEVKKNKDDYARLLKKSAQQPTASTGDSQEDSIKKFALSSTGNDPNFEGLLDKFGITEGFVTEFRRILTQYLRDLLRDLLKEEDSALTLFELLVEAKESGRMQPEELDLAHTIRKQRNLIQYSDNEDAIYQTRIIYIVIASALLYGDLQTNILNLNKT